MYQVDNEILQAIQDEDRTIRGNVYIAPNAEQFELWKNGATDTNVQEITPDIIQNFNITESIVSTEYLNFGDCCYSQLDLAIIFDSYAEDEDEVRQTSIKSMLKNGSILAPYISVLIDDEYKAIPMGVYYIDTVTTANKYVTVQVTAYDYMSKLTDTVTTTLDLKAEHTITELMDDISSSYDFKYQLDNMIDTTVMYTLIGIPSEECSVREYISYLAGMIGRNAIFNREGVLELRPFAKTDIAIPYSNIRTLTHSGDDVNVGSVTVGYCTTDESDEGDGETTTEYNVGSGVGISYSCPYATQNTVDTIYKELIGDNAPFTYTPCELVGWCNPLYEVGDIVNVYEDTDVLQIVIMEQVISYTGGLNVSISCFGSSDENTTYLQKSVSNSYTRAVTQNLYQQSIIKAGEAFSDKTGGKVVLIDTDGDNITDELIASEYTTAGTEAGQSWLNSGRCIRLNHNGIAFSRAGFNGFYTDTDKLDVAIAYDDDTTSDTYDKYVINADIIRVGNLKGIGIDFSNGSIADWIVETDNDDKQIRQTIDTGSGYYDFILKNDKSPQTSKKIIYSNGYAVKTLQNSKFIVINYADDVKDEDEKFEQGGISYTVRSNLNESYNTIIQDENGNDCTASDDCIFTMANGSRYICKVYRNDNGNISDVGISRYWLDKDGNLIRGDTQGYKGSLNHDGKNIIDEGNKTEKFYIKRNGECLINKLLCRTIDANDSDITVHGNFKFDNDCDWTTFTFTSDFQAYSSSSTLRYRRYGKTVDITGACTPTKTLTSSTTTFTIGTLPASCRPTYQIRQLCQGSGNNIWLLGINTDGTVTFSRYRNGGDYVDAPQGAYLTAHCTFLVD